MSNLDLDKFLQDITTLSCNCRAPEFIDQNHKQIGWQSKECEKKETISYSPKGSKITRKQKYFYGKVKVGIIAGLNESVEAWCTKHGHANNLFNEWKSNTIQEVDSGIYHLARKRNILCFKRNHGETRFKCSTF